MTDLKRELNESFIKPLKFKFLIEKLRADSQNQNSENPEKEFLRFHNLAGNVNLSPDRILRIIRKDYQQEDIDR